MNREKVYGMLQGIGIVLSICLFLVATGCLKTYKLAPSESPQGQEHRDPREVTKANVRSAKVYKEWATDAMFDVLWMSDEARTSYVDQYCLRRGKTEKGDMLVKEMEKNDKNITFFVLADVRDKFHASLAEEDPAWTIYLKTDQGIVRPTSIKEVVLDSEIVEMFGHRFTTPKFKTPYEVVFPAKDASGNVYIGLQSAYAPNPFKMVISSTQRQCELGWRGAHHVVVKKVESKCQSKKKRKLIKDEDYYWL